MGHPNCSNHLSGPETTRDRCPSGWVHKNGTIEQPPANPSLTWLFNVIEDPIKRNNVAESNPVIVSQLMKIIEVFNSTHIEKLAPSMDLACDPSISMESGLHG